MEKKFPALACCIVAAENYKTTNETKFFVLLSKEWNSLFCLNFIWSRSGRRDGSERMIIVIKPRYAKGSGCSIVMNIICAFRVRLLPDMNFQVFILFFAKKLLPVMLQQLKRSSSEFTFPRASYKLQVSVCYYQKIQ